MFSALLSENFPPKSKFAVTEIPDLSSKTIIVTGGNTGLGKETVKHLLTHNAKVYIAARSQDKAEAAINELYEETGKRAIFLKLDLANLKSVKASAEAFLSKESELHILFNNGGVMTPPIDMLTDDGYDLQFGTNVLGHFYFTKLLLPALVRGATASSDGKARVVNVSSSALWFTTLDYNTFRDGPARVKKGKTDLYAQSKFGMTVFAHELARRYGDQGIVTTSLTPGVIKTDLQRHIRGVQAFIVNRIANPVSQGVVTQLYAGTHPDGAKLNGKYLMPFARVVPVRPETLDKQTGLQLWDWLEKQIENV
jgi:NAD(P)-dependent dehydrogenase (short-subunit alcohol dehydrogenase family)